MGLFEDKTAVVVGASRGPGRGIMESFLADGAAVVAVARNPQPLAELAKANNRLHLVAADAADPIVAGSLLDQWRPDVLALVAGATPLTRPIHLQTWETLSVNWLVDVRITFHWLREALLLPLPKGSRVIVMSSGAALAGSPLSGGYAGAKSTQRFITDYAQEEGQRAGLGITFTAILPRLTPHTELGRPAVRAYAARADQPEEEYLESFGKPLTPEAAGAAVVELVRTNPAGTAREYLLTGDGLRPLPA